MKRLALTLLVASIAAAGIGNVAAQSYDQRGHDRPELRNDVARVTRVDRMFVQNNQYNQGQLRQECWDERSDRYESGYYRDDQGRLYREGRDGNTKNAVIGAIIGGLVGNQVGDGKGRTAATVAGAAIGAAVGNKSGDNKDHYDRYRDDSGVERRCRTVETYGNRGREREQYRVSYVYAGQAYQTMTNFNPGRTLRVLVDVRPVDEYVADTRR